MERLNRITEKDVDDSLKPVYLEDLMPLSLKERYGLEKHTLREYNELKKWFDRMILEHKTSKSLQRSRGLHDLEVQRPEVGVEQGRAEDEPAERSH